MDKKKIVLASNNSGKVREFGVLLTDLNVEIIKQADLNVQDIEETGLSFVENAILKSRNASLHTNLPSIADDSGIEVDALDGAPGIYSARYAGPNASDKDNINKLLLQLHDVPVEKRTARFQCVIVYMRHANDPTPLICQGTWEGHILLTPQGKFGFGYDPVFLVPEYRCSAAELEAEEKNKISHRAQASALLLSALKQRSYI